MLYQHTNYIDQHEMYVRQWKPLPLIFQLGDHPRNSLVVKTDHFAFAFACNTSQYFHTSYNIYIEFETLTSVNNYSLKWFVFSQVPQGGNFPFLDESPWFPPDFISPHLSNPELSPSLWCLKLCLAWKASSTIPSLLILLDLQFGDQFSHYKSSQVIRLFNSWDFW